MSIFSHGTFGFGNIRLASKTHNRGRLLGGRDRTFVSEQTDFRHFIESLCAPPTFDPHSQREIPHSKRGDSSIFPCSAFQLHPWFHWFKGDKCNVDLILKAEGMDEALLILSRVFGVEMNLQQLRRPFNTRAGKRGGGLSANVFRDNDKNDWKKWWDDEMIDLFYGFYSGVFKNLGYLKSGEPSPHEDLWIAGENVKLNP